MVNYLPIIGTGAEILGLIFLFYDLLRSKTVEAYEESFRSMQDESDSETRKLVIGLHSALATHSNFVAGYLNLEYGSLYKDISSSNHDQVSLTERVRLASLEGFKKAQEGLSSEKEIKRALDQIEAIRILSRGHYIKQYKLQLHLKRTAVTGIILVAVGSLSQLVSMLMTLSSAQ